LSGISRRRFLESAFGGALTAASMGCEVLRTSERRRNLILIMTDQQPTASLGCYGNPLHPTPNLDRLAASGVRFENFRIGAYPCSPSRASLLTGRYPQGHGVYTNDIKLRDDIPSLGVILRDAGFDTAYFGKSHLEGHTYRDVPGGIGRGADGQSYYERFNNGHFYLRLVPGGEDMRFEKVEGGKGEDAPQHGFTTFAGGWKDYRTYLKSMGLSRLVDEFPLVGNHYGIPSTTEERHQHSLIPEAHHMEAFFAKNAVRFIKNRRGKSRPFGMVLSFFGPHLPVAPPRPWDTMFSIEQIELPANHDDPLEGKPKSLSENQRCFVRGQWREEQFKDYFRRFLGYSAYIDSQIGRVLNALRDSGLEENTVVVFLADHGDMLAAHGCIFKIGTAYRELLRVPLLIRAPGVTPEGTVADGAVSSVDVLPTLLDLLDLPKPEGLDGATFVETLKRPERPGRGRVFSHWGPRSFVLVEGEWKFQLHWKEEMDELYNLKEDPGEMLNLAADSRHGSIVKKMRSAILEWLRLSSHPYAAVIRREINVRDSLSGGSE
jgi:arylsulfatase A-like enzyme